MPDTYKDSKLRAVVLHKKQVDYPSNTYLRETIEEKLASVEWVDYGYSFIKTPFENADIIFIYSDHFSVPEISKLMASVRHTLSELILVKKLSEKIYQYNLLKFELVSEPRYDISLKTVLADVENRLKIKSFIKQKDCFVAQNIYPLTNTITVQKTDGIELIPISSIECIQAWEKYSLLYCKDGSRQMATWSMKELEKWLIGHSFIQSHKSHLIHYPSIRSIKKNNVIEMTSGRQVPLARRRRKDFIEWVFENRTN